MSECTLRKDELAVNSDSKYDERKKTIWDKYIDEIVNKRRNWRTKLFWAVSNKKTIEGSAVVKGSNFTLLQYQLRAVKDTLSEQKNNSHSNNDQKKKKHLI
jgi:hypothetical protein